MLRSRVAPNEPLLAEPLGERFTDLVDVRGCVQPGLRDRIDGHHHWLAT